MKHNPSNRPLFLFFFSIMMHLTKITTAFSTLKLGTTITTSTIVNNRPIASVRRINPSIVRNGLHRSSTRCFVSNHEEGGEGSTRRSVTGVVYTVDDEKDDNDHPIVQLYTKEGCTLCDKVAETLKSVRSEQPHSLHAIDITDPDKSNLYEKYKYDIPVLHLNDIYWTKHKLDSSGEAIDALEEARKGVFVERRGEPDAGEMERRMEERRRKE